MNESSPYTVLNVDDVEASRRARTVRLRQAGYRVIEAIDQEEAICLAEQERPALFLVHAGTEERLRILADQAPALMWINGQDGCEYVNHAYLRFLGAGEEAVLGDAWTQFVHPDDRDAYVQAYRDAAARRALFEGTYRLRRHDGVYRWMKSVGTPRVGPRDELLGYVGSSVDISDVQFAAEQAARESDLVLRHALDAAGMSAWHLDLLSGVVRETGQVWKVFNRPPGFVHGTLDVWKEGLHPEDRERVLAAVQRSIEQGVPFDQEYRTRPDAQGLVRWVHSRGNVVCASDGRAVSAYGIARDITDRKRSEEALIVSRQRIEAQHAELELIYRNVPVGLCVLDRDFRFVRINERLAELNGISAKDHLGRTIQEVLPDLADKLETIWRRVLETGEPALNVELRGIAPKYPGVERDWLASYIPLSDANSGHIHGIACVVEDVTDRKRAEEALQESERQFRAMFDLASTGKTLLDARTGRFIRVNDRFCAITGYSREELMRMTPIDLTHPDDRERDMEGFGKLLHGEIDEYHVEKRYVRRDGAVRWVIVSVRLLRDGEGHPLRTTAVIQDVTDRKRAEEALQESEERMRLFIQHAPAAIAMFDRDMRYLAVSRRWLDDYGLEGDIIGRSHYDVFPEIPERWREVHRRGLGGETVSDEADQFERADGTIQWLKWQLLPWRTAAGEVGGVILFTEDITARMLAEELLRTATEHARVGLAVLDAERRYTFVNPAYRELLDLTDTFLIGRRMDEVLGPVYQQACQCLERVYAGERVSYELTVPDRNGGGDRCYAVICEPRCDAGSDRVVGMVAVVTDITERKRAEEDLARVYAFTRQVVDIVPNFIFAKDRDGRFTLVNQAVADCYGTTVEQLIGKTDADVHANDAEVEHFRRIDREVMETGQERRCEERVTDSSGRVRWLETVKRALRDELGGVVQVLGSATDITERKRAQERLQEQARLDAFAARIGKHLVESRDLTDMLGRCAQTIVDDLGALFARIWTLNEGDDVLELRASAGLYTNLEGRHARVAVGSLKIGWIAATRTPTLTNHVIGDPRVPEQEWARRQGIEAFAGYPLIVDDRVVGVMAMFSRHALDDSTLKAMAAVADHLALGIQRRRAEDGLRDLTEHLEQRIAERTEELVHSQRQLRALATELNLTEQRERKRLATELHDHLQQMLVLGKLIVGQGKRHAEPMPACVEAMKQVDEVLSEALAYTRTLVAELSPPVLREHGLEAGLKWLSDYMLKHHMRVTVAGTSECSLPEDQAVLLFQSVRELLINASKYAGTDQATVTLEQRDGELRIVVRDEGAGFDLAAANAAAGIPTGGLSSKFGLFSIRERMKALGGSFDLQSSPGQGTTAALTLPLPDERAGDRPSGRQPVFTVAPDSQISSEVGRRFRVLLVDDHAMVRQGLRSVLEAYPDVEIVGEAGNGEEAVYCVERLRPSIVVMDVNMPGLSGIDATAAIKARHPGTIVIGLSVQTEGENQSAMASAGASVLLTKDAAAEDLYRVIQQAGRVEG